MRKRFTSELASFDVRKVPQKIALVAVGARISWTWGKGQSLTGEVVPNGLDFRFKVRSGGGPWRPVSVLVGIEWTRCNYGGSRPWFLCPRCGRRVALLYLLSHGLGCRTCARLAYESQYEAPAWRLLNRAMRAQATFDRMFSEGRPKGMHWKTYSRKLSRLREKAADYERGIMRSPLGKYAHREEAKKFFMGGDGKARA